MPAFGRFDAEGPQGGAADLERSDQGSWFSAEKLIAGRDTIFALASGPGRSAIAVVRVSGPGCAGAVTRLTGRPLPEPRRLSVRRLIDPETGAPIDQAMVAWMPGPSTYTGEDQAEFHVHGGQAVKAALLRALSRCPGLRLAEPGEFTRRALLNDRLDLAQVEGIADLIEAETEAQRRQALRQLDGALSTRVAGWRDRLMDALVLCEAELDFSDEDDVPDDLAAAAAELALSVLTEVREALAGDRQGERLRDGFTVVIAGPPNAGKSTLLNAIAGRDVAIVSPVPGTTRDAIEVRCDLGGLPVTFVDTAGLRDSQDPVEREGVARARRRMDEADLVLLLHPCDDPGEPLAPSRSPASLVTEVWTKADLPWHETVPADGLHITALAGTGVAALLDTVRRVAEGCLGEGGEAVVTRERHRLMLEEVVANLARATSGGGDRLELVAEDLRLALRALGRVTGQVDAEEVLECIFSTFCIGK